MSFQQTKDVLRWTSDFHQELASEYRVLAESASSDRLRLILEYLADHEDESQRGLRDHLQTGASGVLASWTRSVPALPQPTLLGIQKSCLDNTGSDEITELAVHMHATLQTMYDMLAKAAETDEVRELMESLRDGEAAETRRMVRDIARIDIC